MGKAMRSFRSLGMAMILGIAPAGAHAACLNPGGSGGDIIYNSAVQVMQYCNDANWIAMGKGGLPNAATIPGLVHHWKLEESGSGPFIDDAGSADCTVTSGTMVSVPGKDGNGINHTGDESACGMISELSNASQFTLMGWIKKQTTSGAVFLGVADTDDTSVAIFMANDDYVYWDVTGSDAGWEEAYNQLNDTSWHHYAMVYDGTQPDNATRLKAYIDGYQVILGFTGTMPALSPPLTEDFTLADSTYGDGYVDDVRIYNRALSLEEVRAIYMNVGGEIVKNYATDGYFVEADVNNANLGGLAGANAYCLSTLQTEDWNGKAVAAANGQLTADYVQAWLCSASSCQNLRPHGPYLYSTTLYPSNVGTVMTADGNGFTADDFYAYADTEAFGGGGFREYFTGRDGSDNGPQATTCGDWSTTSGATYVGVSDTGAYEEKISKYTGSCGDPREIICMVHPVEGCLDPAGQAGDILYNQSYGVMQYCSGVQWVAMSNATVTDPCASGSVTSGTVCNSGRVYVGTTPDGSVPMYTTRCGQGQTWNGTSCTGTLSGIQWNNGSGTGTDTAADSATDGDGNTAALLASGDSNAPYAAAQACAGLGSDWYLPALDELDLLNDNNANGALSGTFAGAGSGYWSSTEDDSELAFRQFIPGSQSSSGKYQSRAVRCVSKSMGVGTCNSPSGNGGDMIYNTGTNTMQYCNGSGWVKVGK